MATARVTFILMVLLYIFQTVMTTAAAPAYDVGTKWLTIDGKPSLFMGHRGELVLMPEHTLGSYEFAAIEGADYVEPDIMVTKDGFLACYHDIDLTYGTNVADLPQFAYLQRNFSAILGNKNITIYNGWFIADFTLTELRQLRVKQRDVGIRPQYFNTLFQIPIFEEFLEVILNVSAKLNKTIDIVPEVKHPAYHNSQHESEGPHFIENKVLATLKSYGYPVTADDVPACGVAASGSSPRETVPCGHVIIQSFEKESLDYLFNVTNNDLLMLVDNDEYLLSYEGLDDISRIARYYCVDKKHLFPDVLNGTYRASNDTLIPYDKFVEEAHQRNIRIGIYTINDSREDPDKAEELQYLFNMGVDFMFVENINEARELRQAYECA